MPELPTTAIALVAFIAAGAAALIWKIVHDNNTASEKTVATFMTYIEKKNGNLERATAAFLASAEVKNKQFEVMLADHDKRHQTMMDDMAARLEASLPINK